MPAISIRLSILYRVSVSCLVSFSASTVTGSLSRHYPCFIHKGNGVQRWWIPRRTWLESGGTQRWTQAVGSQSSCSPPLLPPGPRVPRTTSWLPEQESLTWANTQVTWTGLLDKVCQRSPPEFWLQVWGEAQEPAFLTTSCVMLMVLAWCHALRAIG